MCGNVVIEILNADILEPLVTETIEIPGNIVLCDGLKPSYPTATTPLSDTDKFLVRQGSDWKEVDKSEVGGSGSIAQMFGYEFSVGNFYMIAGYYMVSHQDNGVTSTVMSKINVSSDVDAISHTYTKGKVINKTGEKIKTIYGYVRIGYGVNVRLIVGRKHYLDDGTLQSEVILATALTLTNGTSWQIDVNSDVEFESGDEIVLILDARSLSGNIKISQLYNKIITE